MRYDIFFSYAQTGSPDLASAIVRRIKTFGRKWYRVRGVRVFRDASDLGASEHLWSDLARRIEQSHHFLLVATPEAAGSKWVQKEILKFFEERESRDPKERGQFLIALLDGAILWSEEDNDFDWQITSSLPRSLANAFPEEPLHIDFRNVESIDGSYSRKELDRLTAALLSGVLATPPEGLVRRRQLSWRLSFLAGLIFMLAIASLASYLVARSVSLSREVSRREEASNVIEVGASQLDRFENEPIRSVSVEVETSTLPGNNSTIEVRLIHNSFSSAPMRFFIARLDERSTWPKHLELDEPEPIFRCNESPVAGWFQWYEHDLGMITTIPLAGEAWSRMSIEFDGHEFDPEGPFSLPQSYEIPPLLELLDRDAEIVLFLHEADGTVTPLEDASVRLELRANFTANQTRKSFALYRNSYTEKQREALLIDYLVGRDPIEIEALLGLYEAAEPESRQASRRMRDLYKSGGIPASLEEGAHVIGLEVEEAVTDVYTSFGEGNVAGVRHLERAFELSELYNVEGEGESANTLLCWEARATRIMLEVLLPTAEARLPVVQATVQRHEDAIVGCDECFQLKRRLRDLYISLAAERFEANGGQSSPSVSAAVSAGLEQGKELAASIGTSRSTTELREFEADVGALPFGP